jgi:uncharacterized membrane protein (UPF0127 family)
MLSACGTQKITLSSFDGTTQAQVTVEVVDTPETRTRGLMERSTLEEGQGMLFVFREPEILTFWMKNTLIPLEVLFFDQSGEFVNVIRMQPCANDPCPQYKSAALSQYALEVNPGFRELNGIGTGWKIDTAAIAKFSTPE